MTNVERCRRHFGHSSMCTVCNAADESILHVLRDCVVASAVWQRLAPSSLSPEFYMTNLQLWVINNLSSRIVHPEGGMPWPTLFISTLWQLWKSRNDWVFINVMLPIEVIRNRAITWTRYYSGVEQHAPPTASLRNAPCLWKRPESGCICLNVDGVVSSITNIGSIGGLLRDHNACLGSRDRDNCRFNQIVRKRFKCSLLHLRECQLFLPCSRYSQAL
ncbi:hypothetical protein GQ457_04G026920 [Hibiscus cannabinus]